jgi:hypothetical protein
MAKGKKTGGRQKGVPNRATAAKVAEIAASGLTPLDYMLTRDEEEDPRRRDDMAKASAPYVHPRLAAVGHSGTMDLSLGDRLDEAFKRIEEEPLCQKARGG